MVTGIAQLRGEQSGQCWGTEGLSNGPPHLPPATWTWHVSWGEAAEEDQGQQTSLSVKLRPEPAPGWTLLLWVIVGDRGGEKSFESHAISVFPKKPTYDLCSFITANLAPAGLLDTEGEATRTTLESAKRRAISLAACGQHSPWSPGLTLVTAAAPGLPLPSPLHQGRLRGPLGSV